MKQKTGRKLLGVLLTLAMVVGLVPGMSLTAYAATDIYTTLMNNRTVVHFNEYDWYIIKDESSATGGTVTLLSADTKFGTWKFSSNNSNSYNGSGVKTYLDSIVAGTAGEGKPNFANVASAIKEVTFGTQKYNSEDTLETTEKAKLYLLSTAEANTLSQDSNLSDVLKLNFTGGSCSFGEWWLRSPGHDDNLAACVFSDEGFVYVYGCEVKEYEFGVRPALKLDLSKVTFDSATNTFSVGAATETYTVTWKSQDGTGTYETDTDVAKDTKPSYGGSAPTKAEDDNYTYTFAGWATSANQESGTAASDLPAVTDNVTYYAAFSKTQKQSSTAYDSYVNTVVHFDGKDWYLIEDNSTALNAGTVTLLTKECVAASKFNENGGNNTYSGSIVETAVNNYYTKSISSNVKSAIVDNKMFLLTKEQANAITNAEVRKCSNASNGGWWLGEQGAIDTYAACVSSVNGEVIGDGADVSLEGGVRPALKLDLSKVTFDSATNTFSVGAATETYTVTWKSQDGTGTYETDTDVAKDTKPSYGGSAPTKAEDDNYTYTFAGWATSANQESGTAASDLPAVTNNVTYYAAFSKTQKQSSTAYDDLNTNDTTVQIEGVKYDGTNVADWYVIGYDSEAKTVTLLSKQAFASMAFNSDMGKGHDYVGSDIEAYVKGLIGEGQPLAGIKDALANISGKVTGDPSTISGAVPYLLSYAEANALSTTKKSQAADSWWLRSPGSVNGYGPACVYGGNAMDYGPDVNVELAVRPALKLNLSKVTFDSSTKKFELTPVVEYPLWVGGVQVTSANKDDVLGDTDEGATVSYDVYTNTLTLNGADIAAGYTEPGYNSTRGIYYSGNDSLNIVLSTDSDNKVGVTGNVQIGIESSRNITISGAGKLTVKGSGNYSVGIEAYALTIKDAEINVEGALNGIQTQKYGYGVNIISGKVNAIGQTGTGIHSGLRDVNDQTNAVTIGENATVVAIGGNKAINYLKNAIAGTGWTDPEDNTSKTTISISSEGQSIDTLKKMAFPKLPASTVTTPPEANNLTFTGSAQELVTAGEATGGEMKYALGTKDAATEEYTTSIPTATDAGTYYVWYKVKGDDAHADSEPDVVTVTIGEEILVKYESNGGSGTMNDQKVEKGVDTALNANTFTRDGYTFKEWNTKADGSGDSYYDKAKVNLNSSLTLYAQWKEIEKHTHHLEKVEAVEPGCETEGNKEYYRCTDESCDKWFEDVTMTSEITDKSSVIIKAKGHKWDNGEVTKEATYDEEGIRTYTCSVCGETKTESIKKKERPSSYDDSDDSSSDDSDSGSSSSSGSSSKRYTEAQAKVDQINNVSTYSIPENHQVESGVPASDIGGRWGNNANADTWIYTKSDGTLAKSEWMSLDYNGLRYWYYFNEDGNMHTNWFDYKGERFYLMPDKDGWRGRMATGWKNIENKWYYFETVPGSSQGRLYRSTVTPDGHTVGADGAWNGVGATPVGQK